MSAADDPLLDEAQGYAERLKVSGVNLLEKDIGERRPAYRDYVANTNAFVPGRPRGGPLS